MTKIRRWGFPDAVQIPAAGLVAATLASVGPAKAVDMLPMKAPAYKVAYNWSGCYVGGYVGWADGNNWNTTDVNGYGVSLGGAPAWNYSLNSSAIGGGYAGCNWQPIPGGGFVFGIESEGGYLNLNGPGGQPLAVVFPVVGGVTNVTDFSKIGTGYGMIGGRVGYVFLEKIHVYGKAGVGFYNDHSTITNANLTGGPVIASASKSQTPLVFGGGAEYALTEHWIGKAEYLYFETGSSYMAVGVGAGASFPWKENASSVQTFKIGAAYKF